MLTSVTTVRFLTGTVASIHNFVDGEDGPATAGVRKYLFQQGIAEWCLVESSGSHGLILREAMFRAQRLIILRKITGWTWEVHLGRAGRGGVRPRSRAYRRDRQAHQLDGVVYEHPLTRVPPVYPPFRDVTVLRVQ